MNQSNRPGSAPYIASIVVLLAVTMAACGSGRTPTPTRPPTPTPDPWSIAINQTTQILRQEPDFEFRVRNYQKVAEETNQYLGSIEQIRPALAMVDQLRRTNLPVVGNAWKALIAAMDMASSGTGQALEMLDGLVRQVLEFKGKLDGLRGVDAVADASQRFRNSPSRETLVGLRNACSPWIPVLESITQVLGKQLETLAETLSTARLAQQGLREAGRILNMPGLEDSVRSLNRAVDDVVAPIEALQNSGEALRRQMERDLNVMRSIQGNVQTAESSAPWTPPAPTTSPQVASSPVLPPSSRIAASPIPPPTLPTSRGPGSSPSPTRSSTAPAKTQLVFEYELKVHTCDDKARHKEIYGVVRDTQGMPLPGVRVQMQTSADTAVKVTGAGADRDDPAKGPGYYAHMLGGNGTYTMTIQGFPSATAILTRPFPSNPCPPDISYELNWRQVTRSVSCPAPSLSVFSPQVRGNEVWINGVTLSSCATVMRITWYWGDGSFNDSWFPATHRYVAPGSYTVRVMSFDNAGNAAVEEVSVTIAR